MPTNPSNYFDPNFQNQRSYASGGGSSYTNNFLNSQNKNRNGLTPAQLYDQAQQLFSQATATFRENPRLSLQLRERGKTLMKEASDLANGNSASQIPQASNFTNQFSSLESATSQLRPSEFASGQISTTQPTSNPFKKSKANMFTALIGQSGDGGGDNDAPTFSSYIESAKALLRAVLTLMVQGVGNNNPFFNIAKLLTGKSMVEVAKSLTEAGMTDEVVNNSPMLRHEALLVDTQASGLRGLFETAIQYWNQAAQANKQIEKDTHQLAQRA